MSIPLTRMMRFTTAALACNAVCLGFATGLAKAPAKGVLRATPNISTHRIGGPLRGLGAGPQAALGNEQRRRGFGAEAFRYISLLRSRKDEADSGDNMNSSETQVRIP